jgi:hypothetical protein
VTGSLDWIALLVSNICKYSQTDAVIKN